MLYWHRTPKLLQWLYPSLTWHKSRKEKTIYLTFDDGPIPEMTPMVLNILNQYRIKATFFCVGDNVSKYGEVLRQVIDNGHQVGNHTQNHLSGWTTNLEEYIENVADCNNQILDVDSSTFLFRPPYGKISPRQIQQIRQSYQIIMWDVLSGDFDQALSPENCLQNTIKATKNGSIVIFHDNIKAKRNLTYVLPKYIEYCLEEGFDFKLL